jgi:hypothetical protein
MAAIRRLGWGGAISLVGGVLLLAFTFFQWYGSQISGPNSLLVLINLFNGGTAWQKLGVVPYFLALAAVAAVAVALLRLVGSHWRPAIPLGAVVGVLGLVAAGLILGAVIWPPGKDHIENIPMETPIETVVFLALAAAVGIAYGGWRTWRAEGT